MSEKPEALTKRELQTLRNLGNEAEAAADEIERLSAEVERLTVVAKKANEQAEHFERLWYLSKDDADRYAFAKTLEGQVVTMETLKSRGAAELDQALDDAMAEDADALNEAGPYVSSVEDGLGAGSEASKCPHCFGKGWNDVWKKVSGHYMGGEVFRFDCNHCEGTGTALSHTDAAREGGA